MANSLFDQLQKSGLIDEKKAKKAKQNQYKSNKQKKKKGTAAELDEAKLLAQKAHAEKVERDRLLNQQRKEEAERKAIAAQIKQLIESNCIKDRDGDIAYNFTDANVVKKIHVSEQVHKGLSSGRLTIVKLNERYELVPTPVADKIKQRDEQYVISTDKTQSQVEDDAYADYKIPDDLMW
ncbi:MAG: DUF2058 domain-containing protein [Gammaproteobacteria bacterium]|nr:DUF2058 domain-containing protein [Gammaproteobacteria bacterium]MDH5691721.1 DUF2058 domain-containing protein [Gammaproteobacteria bacterium]